MIVDNVIVYYILLIILIYIYIERERDSLGGTFNISNGGVFGSMLGTPMCEPQE